jgi:hypothetical protein
MPRKDDGVPDSVNSSGQIMGQEQGFTQVKRRKKPDAVHTRSASPP